MKNETYQQFVDKFKPKKTTDDCYTPQSVYDAIRDYVDQNIFSLDGRNIVRPFYPGGDYEHYDYKPGDFVLDNPPFSILAQIIRFYLDRKIDFFIFAPALTLFNYAPYSDTLTLIAAHGDITYENGATVRTSFVTNVYPDHPAFVVDGRLNKIIRATCKSIKPDKTARLLQYPPNVVNAAMLGKISERGLSFVCPRSEAKFIRKMDCGQQLYGAGFLLSERMAAERMAAERMAAERMAAERMAARKRYVFELSDREQQMIKDMEDR